MKIVLASRNKKKIAELEALLGELCGNIEVCSLDDIGYSDDIEENGESFEENALIKASVPASMGYIGVADDSGLCVDALGGAPGIYSARFSEEGGDEANNAKLLREMGGIADEARSAAFVCTMACVVPKKLGVSCVPNDEKCAKLAGERAGLPVEAFTVRGECRGVMLESPRGDGGFGYDPLFYVPQKDKTFSQLSADEKNEISHRGRAMRSFAELLKEMM